jgi:hypothetical protein
MYFHSLYHAFFIFKVTSTVYLLSLLDSVFITKIYQEFAMVDVKTEERHAHEHEILLGKYENGNMNLYCKYFKSFNQTVVYMLDLFSFHFGTCVGPVLLYFIISSNLKIDVIFFQNQY